MSYKTSIYPHVALKAVVEEVKKGANKPIIVPGGPSKLLELLGGQHTKVRTHNE